MSCHGNTTLWLVQTVGWLGNARWEWDVKHAYTNDDSCRFIDYLSTLQTSPMSSVQGRGLFTKWNIRSIQSSVSVILFRILQSGQIPGFSQMGPKRRHLYHGIDHSKMDTRTPSATGGTVPIFDAVGSWHEAFCTGYGFLLVSDWFLIIINNFSTV